MTAKELSHLNTFLDRSIIQELHEPCMRAVVTNAEEAKLLMNDGYTWYQIIDASMPKKEG